MGLFNPFARLGSSRHERSTTATHPKLRRQRRRGHYELMEPRRLLAADIHIGLVYYEDASGEDEIADRFELTFIGGAEGTQLTELVIDTDKEGNGLTIGDVFFDTAAGGLGAFQAAGFSILQQDGIGSVDVDVADGGTQLVLRFDGFEAGDRLVFSIDVDEQGFLGPNAVAEGNEVEGSILTATFRADHYFDATSADIFIDAYDAKLDSLGLDLPHDNYVPPGVTPQPVRTAGAMFALEQVPLPITISGTVFEDFDLDNTQDAGEPGISGVTVALWKFNGSSYVATGVTATTDANGHYEFDDVLPGQYRLVETQPTGLFSVGAKAGTVDGATRGSVTSVDVISNISLLGGEDSIRNDFAEARPATLSGHVFHDADDDGVRDAGESGIGGVTIEIQRIPDSGPLPGVITVTTASDGSWSATGLQPGNYLVREVQPAGYFDGKDAAGTAGGTAHNPGDLIDGIFLASGQSGVNYDFGELLPGSISGRVHADLDGDCILDPEEQPLEGVTVYLIDATGERIDSTTTDANGRYEFNGLAPGTYGVEEVQPNGYYQGDQHVGSAGGNVAGPDKITNIVITSGVEGIDYNFCEQVPVSISGRVHADLDGDCILDPGEQPLAGVTIYLLDATGERIDSTTTDSDGVIV